MIGILDPALLLPRPGEDLDIETELDRVAQICHIGRIELPALEEYWPDLWQEHGRALERTLSSRRAQRALGELRKRGRPKHGLPPLQSTPGRVYGLRQMFDIPSLGPGWLDKMTNALVRASATGTPTVLLTRRIVDRNILLHEAEDSRIEETTRWVLYVHMSGRPPRSVLCFHHPRNISLHWTTRYDWRLPSTDDGARYPFCPPDSWWKGRRGDRVGALKAGQVFVDAVVTMKRKPAFIDAKGNGWARPNINGGRGHHWDVFIADATQAKTIGLRQLNIVEVGAPPEEGLPGSIHHVPTKKKARLLNDTGWTC